MVTPRAGVWIEMALLDADNGISTVTPRAGVWIEIVSVAPHPRKSISSLPVRECGLKYKV